MTSEIPDPPSFAQFPVDPDQIGAAIRVKVDPLSVSEKGQNISRLIDLCVDAFQAVTFPEPDPEATSDFNVTPEEQTAGESAAANEIERLLKSSETLGERFRLEDVDAHWKDFDTLPSTIAKTFGADPSAAERHLREMVRLAAHLRQLETRPARGRPPRKTDLEIRIVHAVAVYCDEEPELVFRAGWSTATKEGGGQRGGARPRLSSRDLVPPLGTASLTDAIFRAVGLYEGPAKLRTDILRYRDEYLKGARRPVEVDLGPHPSPES